MSEPLSSSRARIATRCELRLQLDNIPSRRKLIVNADRQAMTAEAQVKLRDVCHRRPGIKVRNRAPRVLPRVTSAAPLRGISVISSGSVCCSNVSETVLEIL